MLRRGSAGANTAADHPAITHAAIAAPPPGVPRKLVGTRDGGRARHAPVAHPDKHAAHRVQARVEDAIRTGKDCGIGHFPSFDFGINAAWLTASMTGQILLAWLKLLALDGDLAKAEPKTLRYRVLHAAARLVRGGRRRCLKIQATWPWADAITAAWQHIDALPQAP